MRHWLLVSLLIGSAATDGSLRTQQADFSGCELYDFDRTRLPVPTFDVGFAALEFKGGTLSECQKAKQSVLEALNRHDGLLGKAQTTAEEDLRRAEATYRLSRTPHNQEQVEDRRADVARARQTRQEAYTRRIAFITDSCRCVRQGESALARVLRQQSEALTLQGSSPPSSTRIDSDRPSQTGASPSSAGSTTNPNVASTTGRATATAPTSNAKPADTTKAPQPSALEVPPRHVARSDGERLAQSLPQNPFARSLGPEITPPRAASARSAREREIDARFEAIRAITPQARVAVDVGQALISQRRQEARRLLAGPTLQRYLVNASTLEAALDATGRYFAAGDYALTLIAAAKTDGGERDRHLGEFMQSAAEDLVSGGFEKFGPRLLGTAATAVIQSVTVFAAAALSSTELGRGPEEIIRDSQTSLREKQAAALVLWHQFAARPTLAQAITIEELSGIVYRKAIAEGVGGRR